MALKQALLDRCARWLASPRVWSVLQDGRFVKGTMAAVEATARAQTFAKDVLQQAARAMALATEAEVKDLRRTVRQLEDEIAVLKKGQS